MVLEEEFYPHHGGYQKQGYGRDYYSNNGYGGGHKEDYYSSENSSSVQTVRPNIFAPEPPRHFALGKESHHSGYHHGAGDDAHHGFSGSGHHGGGQVHHGGYGHGSFGQQIHGYPKPTSPFSGSVHNHHHGGGASNYETEHGSYIQQLPGKYESISYDYYGEGRNRCPTVAPAISSYYGQPHHHHNNKSNHWTVAKGVSDDAEWVSKAI